MTEHIILRDLNAAGRIAGPYDHTLGFPGPVTFGAPSAGPAAEVAAPEPQVESADLDDRDVMDLSRDPQIAGLAPVIPTCLIAPVASGALGTGDSWGIAAIGADTTPFGGDGVLVAVLDTGIDSGHAAFTGVDLFEVDFTRSGNGDQQGHGTHCAGTIFGRDVEGRRIGVARGVGRALIGKVLGADGRGTSVMAFRGMQWAADEGAEVISMSLGFDFPGHVANLVAGGWPVDIATSVALVAYRANLRVFDSFMAMMQARAAILRGPVVVAAAGNESRTNIRPDFTIAVSLPAAAEGIISVGALLRNGDLFDVASFSNRFPEVSAPGVDIVSARLGGGLVANSGTSMACPHVAGVAALWTQALRSMGHTQLTPALVRAKILAGAHTDGFLPHVTIPDRGAGRIVAPA